MSWNNWLLWPQLRTDSVGSTHAGEVPCMYMHDVAGHGFRSAKGCMGAEGWTKSKVGYCMHAWCIQDQSMFSSGLQPGDRQKTWDMANQNLYLQSHTPNSSQTTRRKTLIQNKMWVIERRGVGNQRQKRGLRRQRRQALRKKSPGKKRALGIHGGIGRNSLSSPSRRSHHLQHTATRLSNLCPYGLLRGHRPALSQPRPQNPQYRPHRGGLPPHHRHKDLVHSSQLLSSPPAKQHSWRRQVHYPRCMVLQQHRPIACMHAWCFQMFFSVKFKQCSRSCMHAYMPAFMF